MNSTEQQTSPEHGEQVTLPRELLDALGELISAAVENPTRFLPVATYRIQLNRDFGFRDAAAIVPLLKSLGISHLYLSPILTPRTGSNHGYDIVDHGRLHPECGGAEGFAALCAAVRDHGMGLILDVVPNHMCVTSNENTWWQDVLKNGRSSPYADHFDIDWDPVHPDLRDRVLYPVLADSYGAELESEKLQLDYSDGEYFVRYYDFRLPLDIRSYKLLLNEVRERIASELGEENPHRMELESILRAIEHIPPHRVSSAKQREERRREQHVIRRRLQNLESVAPAVAEAIRWEIAEYNGKPADPASFDPLDRLLQQQPYRLAFWRVATDEINYRRFFDVNDLAAIRVELPEVFESTHRLLLQLFDTGVVTGWRIDHVDGLFDPTEYLLQVQGTRLLQMVGVPPEEQTKERALAAIRAWLGRCRLAQAPPYALPFYLVVEKILEAGESIPAQWPVHGTTGYDFLNLCNGLQVARHNGGAMTRLYHRFTGSAINFFDLLYESKTQVMETSMSAELQVLGHTLDRISEKDRWSRDFTLASLTDAIREVVACFPVYRTYINSGVVSERDRRYIDAAVAAARRRNPALSRQVFDFVRDCLLVRPPRQHSPITTDDLLAFVRKFQQFTGPVMAKGMEDTAFYRYNRLCSLNEVGGEPQVFGISVEHFHESNRQRQERWPFSMLATSTHDTKRSEDVRCRINVLTEVVLEWHRHVFKWARWNKSAKSQYGNELAPSRNDEYLLYQTLVGTWPISDKRDWDVYVDRIANYMLKAIREAKVHTSWVSPDETYEGATLSFVRNVLDRTRNARFIQSLDDFASRIAYFGAWNSLAQVVLKVTCPGVPDFFQGTERWNDSLVDPDNRRPVDFERLRQLLEVVHNESTPRLWKRVLENPLDDLAKVYVTCRALSERGRNPLLYTIGRYVPLTVLGTHHEHIVAFAREFREERVIVVVPRLIATLVEGRIVPPVGEELWADTAIDVTPLPDSGREYLNILTDERITPATRNGAPVLNAAEVFRNFPLAILRWPAPASGTS